ncbi:amino acid adenylation domain-containing protein [Chitinophaga dinghuensis]|uniref:Amino acid adenylation domain-containing protein n=1 Tax=Chitinophaga dinghuensis TaxID=1539050 RepID=A0A327W0Q1_9BACT|nr:non-ribosomal peptide synthetase [Chitinophaga dinghuensis]RAJ77622.1 amino acid adenylation domain-containing protein [Chitinophaga dinghuensis]
MKDLLKKITENNILLEIIDGKLRVFANSSNPDPALITEIKNKKEELLQFLSANRDQDAGRIPADIPVAPEQNGYPLSSSQHRLWLLSQLEESSAAYNMYGIYSFRGQLDITALEKAFDTLYNRHESLRTTFAEDVSGTVFQYIKPAAEIPLKVVHHDWRLMDEQTLKKQIADVCGQPFDLHKTPLLRVHLFRTADEEWVLVYVMPHIVSDGWSMHILLQELLSCYQQGTTTLLPLKIQYKDFAVWQQQQLESGHHEQHYDYWMQQLEHELPILQLPGDYTRPAVKTYNGGTVSSQIPATVTAVLQERCRQTGSTLFMGLVAAVNALLYRYTDQEDIVLGTPVAGREKGGLEGIIGFFVNTLAIRNRFSGKDTFLQLLENVRQTFLSALAHQEYPFDELVRRLQGPRDASRHPLFDVMITLQHAATATEQADLPAGLQVAAYEDYVNTTSKFDLTFNFSAAGNNLLLNLEYNSDIYTEQTVRRLARHLTGLLTAVSENPEIPIQEIRYMEETELQQLIVGLNNTIAGYPREATIVSLFEQQVLLTPDRNALVVDDTLLSYRQLNEWANKLADFLQTRYNIQPDDLVGIMLGRSEWMVIAIMGILKSGGAYVPVDTAYPQERIDYMLADSQCKLVIDDTLLAQFLGQADEYSAANPAAGILPANLAYVIYTSGTTGQPKGNLIEHRNVVRLLKTDPTLYDFNETDVWTLFHSYCFDFSVWEIFGPLLSGGELVIVPALTAKDPRSFLTLLRERKVTVLNQTPTSFYNIIQQEMEVGDADLQLRYVIFGGEALHPRNLREWKNKYPATRLINMYGITETTVHVTFKEIGSEEIASGISNIGKPIPTLRCYVLDQRGNPVPVGVPGELYVAGAGVARGYLNKPALTAARFMPDPFFEGGRMYRSGDKVKLLDNGEMAYEGRMDNQVKIRGYRIELGEIENAICRYSTVKGAALLVRAAPEGEKELVAYVVADDDAFSVLLLRKHLSGILPLFMMPHYFVMLKEWPLTANGKINYKLLPEPTADHQAGVEYVAPRNPLEVKLVNIFSTVLKVPAEKIGMLDNMFALGGDSIKAIRIVGKIREEIGAKITVGKLYEYPVLGDLAAWLVDNKEEDSLYEMKAEGLRQIEALRSAIIEEDKDINILPADYEDIYPLTAIEQGMIYSSMIRPEEPVYYDQFPFFVHIADLSVFKTAVATLVQRHPILRTKYYVKSFSRPVKVVLPEIILPIIYEDFSMLSENEQQMAVRDLLAAGQAARLNFDDELFWNFQICRLRKHEYVVIWSFHHAALDGWSVSLFNTELTQLLSTKESVVLPPLKHSYKDYCAILLGRKRSAEVEHYWKELLNGFTRNKLPFNYKRLPVSQRGGMKRISKVMDASLLEKLHELAAKHQFSFKAVCLAAHIYLLHITSAEQDVVTGVVTHDRPSIEDGENILGCFLNTIPVRIRIEQLTDILSLLQATDSYLKTVKPKEIHLSEIAGVLNERTTSLNPVFDTLFNFTDFHTYEQVETSSSLTMGASGWDIREVEDSTEMTNTFFDVEVDKTLDRFQVKIKFMPAFFEDQQVKHALELYVRILEQMTVDVYTPLASMNLLSAGEKQEILTDFNDTVVPYATQETLQSLFEAQVRRTPDNIALRQDGVSVTYRELNERANQMASLLCENITTGDNIGLLVTRSFDMIVGMFAILKAGGAYVPIDPEYPKDRQEYILSNSGVTRLLTNLTECTLEGLSGERVIYMQQVDVSAYSKENPDIAVSSRQLAYTIYTSGSTGRPKGVMIEHHSVVNLVSWVNNTFSIGGDDRLLFITSMCFDLSVYDIFGILSAGGTLVIARQEEVQQVETLKTLLLEERITFWDSVPSTLNYLVAELEAAGDTFQQQDLRVAFMSGDWIPVSLPERILRYFPGVQVISLGGATEGTVWSNYFPIKAVDKSWSSIPYGKPIDNNTFYVLDDYLRPVPKGVAGELYIGGVGVAAGYANDKEKTAAAFRPDPFTHRQGGMMYKTGDLGRIMADGNMEFLGRKDFQVKIRGFRVELGEIESVLQRHELIREAVVDVRKDSNNLHQLCAYLVPHTTLDIHLIREYLREKLPAYMIPSFFTVLDTLPLTSNGKINRKALPDPLQEDNGNGYLYVAPESELEKTMERIWISILNIERLGIRDDFFEMGANSLSVGAFVNRFQRETSTAINIRTVFMYPNIESLAAEVEKILWADNELFETDNLNDTENFSI